jgi:GntR family transcriptional regulator, transcriptional repressor for pyruvate dehydrogenase complex
MDLKPVPVRESLVKTVTDQLTRLITSGAFELGARLPTEGSLAERLGVSRTVVREALALLKADNIIRSQRGQGLSVSEGALAPTVLRFHRPDASTREVVCALLEMREGLETQSARLAALRRTEADLLALRETLDSLGEAENQGRDGVDEDLTFHVAIARISGNTFICQVLEFLSAPLRRAIAESRSIDSTRAEYLQAVRAEHIRIFAAIAAGDAEAAGTAMRQHTEAGQRRLAQQNH